MTYYLQDYPNPNFGQFGWPRKRVSGVIGVHTAENNTDFEGADPGAEDVTRFIGRRTDPGSYHAIADADSRIKLIHPSYSAWADTTNNAHGMSVSGAMQAARWRELNPERAAALTRNMALAAAELVKDAIAARLLDYPVPARRITPAEAIAGSKAGFYGHGETNPGRRYDPGENFNWDLFLSTYSQAVNGSAAIGPQGSITLTEEDDMFSDADRANLETTKGKVETLIGMLDNVAGGVNGVPSAILDKQVPRAGSTDTTSLALFLSYESADREATMARIQAAIANTPAPELAAQIDAAGLAASVRDELVKLLGGK